MRLIKLCFVAGVATLVFCVSQFLLEVYLENDHWPTYTFHTPEEYARLFREVTHPVVLWWAPLGGIEHWGTTTQCGQLSCYFTDDRQFRHHPLFKAFMFYGSNLNWTDLPLPRNGSSVLWALLHEESPRNNAPISHEAVMTLFNYTATFSRFSSFPLITQYLKDLQALTDLKYFVTTERKTALQKEEGLAPVVYIQRDCSTTNNRDSYVAELAKYIHVDSYGACLHNKDLPLHLQPPNNLKTMMSDDMLHLVAKYKFMLAIENGICEDYITEKLWRPLISGTIPVYIGSPTVADWLPNNKSALLGMDFDTPKQLADYLHRLNANDEEYNSYLDHKLKAEVTNVRLIQTLNERTWDTEWTSNGKGGFIDKFACFVCQKAHHPDKIAIATRAHYSCPVPVSILSRKPNTTNFWLNSWFFGRCEAQVVRSFVDSGVWSFTQDEFDNALNDMVSNKKCWYSEENARDVDFN